MSATQYPLRTIRSFVRRQGRMSDSKKTALTTLWERYGLATTMVNLDLDAVFQRSASRVLEIGFGMGDSFLQQAQQYPHWDFIGIEVHRPGIAEVLKEVQSKQLQNIRLFCADAIEVLTRCILPASLDSVQIFFPDPWPKKRHQKRRMIQATFIQLLETKLKPQGKLYLATDWEDYANQMMITLSQAQGFKNLYGENQFAPRCTDRALTKFEQRGQQLGHGVWDLVFIKQ